MMVGLHRRMFNLPQLGAVFCPTAKKEKKEEEKKNHTHHLLRFSSMVIFCPLLRPTPNKREVELQH